MKRPTRWRLSRRLLAGFVLLAVVPIMVVGLGIRQYTRQLLDESFVQRAKLTRQLIEGWREQLHQRIREALRRAAADSELLEALRHDSPDRTLIRSRLERIVAETGVHGLDVFEARNGGALLISRSSEPSHFGFPVQAPRSHSGVVTWRAPELEVDCYGASALLDDSSRVYAAAYMRLGPELLAEIGGSGSFLLGCTGFDGQPITHGDWTLAAWPNWDSTASDLADLTVNGQPFTIGAVPPFYFGLSLADRYGTVKRLDVFLLIAILLAISVAVVAAWRVAVSAARPVEELAETVGRWGRGSSREPLVTFAEGETATLVNAFEHLRKELAGAEKRLADAAREAGWQEMARKVAHEIKNPLTPIRVTMEDLARRVSRDPNLAAEMIPEAARLVSEEVTALGRIVDAFSRYAKLPEPHAVRTDLVTVAHDTVQLYASHGGARVSLEDSGAPVHVVVDPQLLREALSNLVKNACEASGAGGRVSVRASGESQGLIEIADSGPGFPEAILKDGPRPYFTTRTGGTGLGLVLAQRIITGMGGDLTLSNGTGGGIARISFPRAAKG